VNSRTNFDRQRGLAAGVHVVIWVLIWVPLDGSVPWIADVSIRPFMAWMFLFIAWLLWCALVAWVGRNPRGDFVTGLVYRGCQLYSRLVQHTTVVGGENLPRNVDAGPLIVVANHTAGVDPVLVQAACVFEIRWMMGSDMMHPAMNPFWTYFRMIGVNRLGRDTASAKEAIRHVNGGGVLGIFPEGGIEKPYGQLMPFMAGVGLIVARTKAPVLPIFIAGTPQSDSAFGSLAKPGHASLTVGALMSFDGVPAAEVVKRVQAWFEVHARHEARPGERLAISVASQEHRAVSDGSLDLVR